MLEAIHERNIRAHSFRTQRFQSALRVIGAAGLMFLEQLRGETLLQETAVALGCSGRMPSRICWRASCATIAPAARRSRVSARAKLRREIVRHDVAQDLFPVVGVAFPFVRQARAEFHQLMIEKRRTHFQAARHAGDIEFGQERIWERLGVVPMQNCAPAVPSRLARIPRRSRARKPSPSARNRGVQMRE